MGGVELAACEAKTRAHVRANNVADLASLLAPSAKILCREAIGKARLSANSEAFLTLLVERTLHGRVKFTSKGRTKKVASPCKAYPSGEAALASPIVKRKAFKARPKTSQPNRANF